MQAKKRAKSVKFGKQTSSTTSSKKEEVKKVEEVTPKIEKEEPIAVNPEEDSKSEEVKEELTNSEEIKQEIAAKISSKDADDEKEADEPPVEVDLTSETPETPSETPTEQEEASQTPPPAAPFGSFTKNFDEPEQKKSNLKFFLVVVLITFVVGILAIGGFYYFSNSSSSPTPAPTPTATPAVEPTATPSPTEEPAKLSEFTIEVLNGSGVSGVAAKVKTQLTDAGFTVGSVGNAQTSDFTKTVIEAKENVSKLFIDSLTKELEKSYAVEVSSKTLTETSESDVVVTVGSSTAAVSE